MRASFLLLLLTTLIQLNTLFGQELLTDYQVGGESTFGGDEVIFNDTLFALQSPSYFHRETFLIESTLVESRILYRFDTLSYVSFDVDKNNFILFDGTHSLVYDRFNFSSEVKELEGKIYLYDENKIYAKHDTDQNTTLNIYNEHTLSLESSLVYDNFKSKTEKLVDGKVYVRSDDGILLVDLTSSLIDTLYLFDRDVGTFLDTTYLSIQNNQAISYSLFEANIDTIESSNVSVPNFGLHSEVFHYYIDSVYHFFSKTTGIYKRVDDVNKFYYAQSAIVYQDLQDTIHYLTLDSLNHIGRSLQNVDYNFDFDVGKNDVVSLDRSTQEIAIYNFESDTLRVFDTDLRGYTNFHEVRYFNDNFYLKSQSYKDGIEFYSIVGDTIEVTGEIFDKMGGDGYDEIIFDNDLFITGQVLKAREYQVQKLEDEFISIGVSSTKTSKIFEGGEFYYLAVNDNVYSLDKFNNDLVDLFNKDTIFHSTIYSIESLYEKGQKLFIISRSPTDNFEIFDLETHKVIPAGLNSVDEYMRIDDLLYYTRSNTFFSYNLNTLERTVLANIGGSCSEMHRFDDKIILRTSSTNSNKIWSYNLNNKVIDLLIEKSDCNPLLNINPGANQFFITCNESIYKTNKTLTSTKISFSDEGDLGYYDNDFIVLSNFNPTYTTIYYPALQDSVIIYNHRLNSLKRDGDILYIHTQNNELIVFDSKTRELKNLINDVNKGFNNITSSLVFNNKFFFSHLDPSLGYELYSLDTTTFDLELVYDINPGFNSSRPYDFFVYKDELYFEAYHETLGNQLWRLNNSDVFTQVVNVLEKTNQINLYPNPTKTQLNIEVFGNTHDTQIKLTSLSGEEVFTVPFSKTIDVSNVEQGMYLLTLIDKNGNVLNTEKFVKL